MHVCLVIDASLLKLIVIGRPLHDTRNCGTIDSATGRATDGVIDAETKRMF